MDRVAVGGIGVVERVEEQTVLQRRKWPDIYEIRVGAFPALDLLLPHRDQCQVGRGASARARRGSVRRERPQRQRPQLRESTDIRLVEQPRGVGPGDLQTDIGEYGVDIDDRGQRRRLVVRRRETPWQPRFRVPAGERTAEIVEAELRGRRVR